MKFASSKKNPNTPNFHFFLGFYFCFYFCFYSDDKLSPHALKLLKEEIADNQTKLNHVAAILSKFEDGDDEGIYIQGIFN